MNDSAFPPEQALAPLFDGEGAAREEVPQFGAIDIVEAFTAMRHEYRGQVKESRGLAEQIQTAVADLQSMELKLRADVNRARGDDTAAAKSLALLIVETEHQLSRGVAAMAQWELTGRLREDSKAKAIERCVAEMNGAARWFSRPLLALLSGQNSVCDIVEESPALAGLNMVLARHRRMMCEHGIERIDVLGLPFDPDSMHAIGVVHTDAFAAGSVAEQLSPAYRWQGYFLRFADVRVAAPVA